jgi:DNA-binding MarR family transcriptional regulator
MAVDGATVTRLVKRLESEGTVVRRLDPDDNRFTLASLTAAGERLVAELHAAHRTFQRRLLAGVGAADQDTVVRVLGRLRVNIGALEPDEAGAHQAKGTRR